MAKLAIFLATAATLAAIPTNAAMAAMPPDGGSISIEPAPPGGDAAPVSRSFVEAVSEALAAKGFTILEDSGHAAYVADLILSRVEVGTGLAKVAAGRGEATPGGAYGSVGAGVTIPLPTGNSEIVPLQRIRLELRVHKRGDAAVIWDGAAVTVRAAGTRKGTDEAVAADLSGAILRGYPVEPEGIVGVP